MLKYFTASVFVLVLISCQSPDKTYQINGQELKEDPRITELLPVEDSTQQAMPAVAPALPQDSQLDSVFSYLHRKKGFNGTVLVTKHDQVIYKGAFGYADFRRKDTLHTQTAFQLASVSKQFTAMAIMMLKEQGKLDYDDSVQLFIPEFPYQGITIRQLLTHRSGLSNYTYFSDELWPDRSISMTNEDVLNLMKEHKPDVYYQPDRRFDYSNTGYCLLASVVERTTGIPFATFLQKNIFDPLEMTHTFTFSDSLTARTEKVATGHTGGKRKRSSDYLDTVLGDKGVYSTVEDLYKWDQALYTEKLVTNETLEEAFTGSILKKKKKQDYGFGWRITEVESGDKVVFHAGLWHGYNTYLLRNPNDHSALIVLSNVPNGSLKYLKDIQQLLYPARPLISANDDSQSKEAESMVN